MRRSRDPEAQRQLGLVMRALVERSPELAKQVSQHTEEDGRMSINTCAARGRPAAKSYQTAWGQYIRGRSAVSKEGA